MTAPRGPRRPGEEDYHDPTAGFMGAPGARSALALRLVLAVFGLVACGAGGVVALILGATAFGVVLLVLAVVAAVDAVVVLRRRAAVRRPSSL